MRARLGTDGRWRARAGVASDAEVSPNCPVPCQNGVDDLWRPGAIDDDEAKFYFSRQCREKRLFRD